MKGRALIFVLVMASCLLAALSTGGSIYWLFFLVLAVMGGLSLLSVLIAWATLSCSHALPEARVQRTGEITLLATVQHSAPLPIAPVLLRVVVPDAAGPMDVRLAVIPFRRTQLTQQLFCPHVGEYPVGLVYCAVSDVFGLFSLRKKASQGMLSAIVIPCTFPVRPLTFAPGDSGNDLMARATDDATSPADVRAYQDGDELKRVHWKLTMRKRELMVRRFEEPARPDALILMNCAPPTDDPEASYTVRDALCETAASLAEAQLAQGNIVRMPLLSAHAQEVQCDNAAELPFVLDALAHVPFDGTDRFERVLLLETRRMRRTGGTVVITSRMDARTADMLLRIRRMGPRTRLYLIHEPPIAAELDMLLSNLERNDIEIETISLTSVNATHETA